MFLKKCKSLIMNGYFKWIIIDPQPLSVPLFSISVILMNARLFIVLPTGLVEDIMAKILAFDQFFFSTEKSKSGLINPFPLMQSKKLYPPHIMFHPASPTVMASQIGLSWGGLGLLCSCCCLIWGLGVLQVLTWPDLKDSQRHINILCETTDYDDKKRAL